MFNKWVYLAKLEKKGYLVEAPGEISSGPGSTMENAGAGPASVEK